MKKVLITTLIVGVISLAGIATVRAYTHYNGDCQNFDNTTNTVNLNHHNCSNYIDENNDGICDNCLNKESNNVNYQHNHHRYGHN